MDHFLLEPHHEQLPANEFAPSSSSNSNRSSSANESRKNSALSPVVRNENSTANHGLLSEEDSLQFSSNSNDYEIGSAIGFCSSAVVYLATYRATGKKIAIKMIDLDRFERNQIDELCKEIQVMCLCKHSNLLRIYASFVVQNKLWIVMPFFLQVLVWMF